MEATSRRTDRRAQSHSEVGWSGLGSELPSGLLLLVVEVEVGGGEASSSWVASWLEG